MISGNQTLPPSGDLENQEALTAERTFPARTASSARDVLIAARKLIEKPENWCQRYAAVDADGYRCVATSSRAIRFCIYGAINRVRAPTAFEGRATSLICEQVPHGFAGEFNDTHTHAEVLAAFDRAIEQCAVGDRTHAAATQTVA